MAQDSDELFSNHCDLKLFVQLCLIGNQLVASIEVVGDQLREEREHADDLGVIDQRRFAIDGA